MFQYSCKVGEFRQIFNNNPDKASMYADKRLTGKYSADDIHVFTNSFRMIHELSNYCHYGSLQRDDLLSRLQVLNTSFEKIPQIGGERISPFIQNGIRELNLTVNQDEFASKLIRLCNELVEMLHIEVKGAEPEVVHVAATPTEPMRLDIPAGELDVKGGFERRFDIHSQSDPGIKIKGENGKRGEGSTVSSTPTKPPIPASPEEIPVTGVNQDITISSESPIKLVVSGVGNDIRVPDSMVIIEIDMSGVNNTVYIPESANPKVKIVGVNNDVVRY